MKTKYIKLLIIGLVLIALSQAKAQNIKDNPFYLPYKWSVKEVKLQYESKLVFTCKTKNRDFGLRLDHVSLNDKLVHVYGLGKWNDNNEYTFTVYTSIPPKNKNFTLIIRDMIMECEKE